MNDKDLEAALEHSLGIFGATGSRDSLHVTYKGAGLKIWGGWHIVNHVQDAPLFQGKATVAMAREVYGIADPEDGQLSLEHCNNSTNNLADNGGVYYCPAACISGLDLPTPRFSPDTICDRFS